MKLSGRTKRARHPFNVHVRTQAIRACVCQEKSWTLQSWTRAFSRLAAVPRNGANKNECSSPNTRPDTQPPSQTDTTPNLPRTNHPDRQQPTRPNTQAPKNPTTQPDPTTNQPKTKNEKTTITCEWCHGTLRHAQVQHAQQSVPCHVVVVSGLCTHRCMAQEFWDRVHLL